MEQNYHYYAFISYSTTDSQWAKWLQHQLSYYHIPSSVKKSKIGIPNKIRPVFIYEYDLAGNQLHTAIEHELAVSKYLIVICSPYAAKSKYVNDEIETFIRMGRSEYIIPFIVDGMVDSSDSNEECFPPALLGLLRSGDKKKELRGINVDTNGKRQALVDLVATMLGVRRDVLWDRYKMRRLKQRILIAAAIVFALLCGVLYWDYTRPTYKYFVDYVDVWGVPTGVLELDKNQIKHRNGSYRFEYRRIPIDQPEAYSWRLSKVSHINSAGTPQSIGETAYNDRYPVQQLTYSTDNGTLIEIAYCNENEKPQIIHKLSRKSNTPASIVDIQSVVAGDNVAFANSITTLDSDDADKKSNITRYVYERNTDGLITKVTFHANNSRDFNSSAVADNFGVWGIAYDLDSLGRRVAIYYLNKDGSYHSNKIGVSTRRYKYDSIGNICSEHTFDLRGNPILNEGLWVIALANFDNYGNVIEQVYYGVDGKPCLSNEGFAKGTAKYDDRGNRIEAACYGVDGKPCLDNYGIAKATSKYDDRGNIIEEAYYGVDGKPCLNNYGFAKGTAKYDDRGNKIEEAYYGVDGKPCLHQIGSAKVTYTYDNRGNIIEAAYYGVDGKPCVHQYGNAKVITKYDDRGNRIEAAYYGVDGKPCLNNYGFAKLTYKYDDRDNRIEEAFYGVDGKPCLNQDGSVKVTYTYDNRGNIIEAAYYGVDGKPCLHQDGSAKVIIKYDDRGNRIEEAYYGVDGKPCLSNEGFAKLTYKYDDRGNRIEEAYYGVDGKPCLHQDGNAKMTYTYDNRGNIIEQVYYGVDGKPCLSNEGFAKGTAKYDDRGNRIEAAYYGVDGKPCLNNYGFAKGTAKYDDRGNRIEAAYYGVDGKPCLHQDGNAKETAKYDDRGNIIEIAYYGVDGKLSLNSYGFAKWTSKYDDRGNIIETTHYGVDGKPCMLIYGYSLIKSNYNDRCQVIETSYYDTERKPVNVRGYFKETRIYDGNNNHQETIYYDKDGKLLSEQIFTRQIYDVSGAALAQEVPVGSIILQYNKWRIGDTQKSLFRISARDKYTEKNVYYLTPTEEFGQLYIQRGLMGIVTYDIMVEKSQAQEWLRKLDEWKKNPKH